MTPQQIKANAPEGATYFDGFGYWKKENNFWFLWSEIDQSWNQMIEYKAFHDTFKIKPL